MASKAEVDGSEDVNDFLLRVRELGDRRDREDEERNRKLEEDIIEGRKERQARRAERARSLSPTKDSPLGTPQPLQSGSGTLKESPQIRPSQPSAVLHSVRRDSAHDNLDQGLKRTNGTLDSDSPIDPKMADRSIPSRSIGTTSPSRASPLSWQQRPASRGPASIRSRPNSVLADTADIKSSASEQTTASDEDTQVSRSDVAHSLSSKDPSWFRQTADRGVGSAAYRRSETNSEVSKARMQLPGMSRESSIEPEQARNSVQESVQTSRSGESSARGSASWAKTYSSSSSVSGFSGVDGRSSQAISPPQRFERPDSAIYTPNASITSEGTRPLAMSPSQGRISPERLERPLSPTKGFGGFVQSAMMKRSDSVTKRWSAQSASGVNRSDSITSNRGETAGSGRSSLTREESATSNSRPGSSQSSTTVMAENTTQSHTNSRAASPQIDNFIKPAIPSQTQASTSDATKRESGIHGSEHSITKRTPPHSPSKSFEHKRWSPTKSSWLESALNKPSEAPKPKAVVPQQPSWMADINKAKQQRGSVDIPKGTTFKTVDTGGLMRAPALGSPTKSTSNEKPKPAAQANVDEADTAERSSAVQSPSTAPNPVGIQPEGSSRVNNTSKPVLDPSKVTDDHSRSKQKSQSTSATSSNTPSPAVTKAKPSTPPKKDFRSNLRPRQMTNEGANKDEPEFKNVFGKLRQTKTQNYVAPDELKNNILRGKAGLAQTGGPKKTDRKDEFKESILKQKEAMKAKASESPQSAAAQVTGRKTSNASKNVPVPEALQKRASMKQADSQTSKEPGKDYVSTPKSIDTKTTVDKPAVLSSSKGPSLGASPLPTKKPVASGKLAERFNPALASIISKGPPSGPSKSRSSTVDNETTSTSKNVIADQVEEQDSSTALTHMTKGRARGPKRRTPGTVQRAQLQEIKSSYPSPVKEELPIMLALDSEPSAALQVRSSSDKDNEASEKAQASVPDHGMKEITQDRPKPPVKLEKPKTLAADDTITKDAISKSPLQSPRGLGAVLNALDDGPQNQRASPSTLGSQAMSPPSKSSTGSQSPSHTFKSSITSDTTTNAPVKQSGLSGPRPPPPSNKAKSAILPQMAVIESSTDSASSSPRSQISGPSNQSPISASHSPRLLGTSRESPRGGPLTGKRSPGMTTMDARPRDVTNSNREDTESIGLGLSSIRSNPSVPNSPVQLNKELPTPPMQQKPFASGVSGSPPLSRKPATLSSMNGNARTPSSPRDKNLPLPPSAKLKDPSQLIGDFFTGKIRGPVTMSNGINVPAILTSRVGQLDKTKTLKNQIWQISANGKLKTLPDKQEHILYEDDMYLCTHYFELMNGARTTAVYLWASADGFGSAAFEDAQLFAKKVAKEHNGKLITIKQGKEPANFFQALGGIVVTRRGSVDRRQTAPFMLCGRKYLGQIAFDEVDLSPANLCSGFPYIVCASEGTAYLWRGKGSSVDEIGCARLIGMDIGSEPSIVEVDEGKESRGFLAAFGTTSSTPIRSSADYWHRKSNHAKYATRLFCISHSSTTKIREIAPFCQSDLNKTEIYCIDTFFEIYIMVGSSARDKLDDFRTALYFAQEYGILAASMEDRPFVPVSTVVMEGVPRDLKVIFRHWRDEQPSASSSPKRSPSLRIMPLRAALEAVSQ